MIQDERKITLSLEGINDDDKFKTWYPSRSSSNIC